MASGGMVGRIEYCPHVSIRLGHHYKRAAATQDSLIMYTAVAVAADDDANNNEVLFSHDKKCPTTT